MRLALTELRRRPGRFVVATVVLTFLSMLLLLLGGLLDGLFIGSTGAIRAQDADAIVYSSNARDSFLRSRIDATVRTEVEGTDGIDEVGGLGVALLAAQVPDEPELANVAVLGYELPPEGVPAVPPEGHAWADETLRDRGASIGDTILIGTAETPLVIDGFVEDTNYLQQSGMWVSLPTWREVQNANRPDSAIGDDIVQVLIVRGAGDVPAAVDASTDGATSSLTRDEAVFALPGVEAQNSTFDQIIYMTLAVVLAVIGLFFSLLTIERTALYGVLKAVGASSRRLFAGVVVQAVVVATIAFVVGSAFVVLISFALSADLPFQLTVGRFTFTFVALVVAAVLGSAISLRRVTRIDPASAIGSSA